VTAFLRAIADLEKQRFIEAAVAARLAQAESAAFEAALQKLQAED
jgi:hypothetical protein